MKIKSFILILIAIVITILLFFVLYNESNESEKNKEVSKNGDKFNRTLPGVERGSNMLSIGLYEPSGELIENSIKINENEKEVVLSFSHYMNFEREYGLIVLQDFKQAEFNINEEKKKFHTFIMEANSTMNLYIGLDISNDIKELSFLVIKDPNIVIHDIDLARANDLQQIIGLRYNVNQKIYDTNEQVFTKQAIHSYDNIFEPVFISEFEDVLQFLPSIKNEENAYLHIGNPFDEELPYVIISFSNWEQSTLMDKNNIFVEIPPKTRNVYSFTFPKVEEQSNFQIIAFPYPYQVDMNNYESKRMHGTLRTVIHK